MYRSGIEYLNEWKTRESRKPLVIRGARQVGKTFLVRRFAEQFSQFIEINAETDADTISLFENNSPQKTIELLEIQFNTQIRPGQALMFIDEIQAAPSVFAKLRYFYEQLPGLHVIAAGSQLELMMTEDQFSTPVGRVEYMYLGPLTFHEYLLARNREKLASFLGGYTLGDDFPPGVHNDCCSLFRTYLITGGMPESVFRYVQQNSLLESDRVKENILATYVDDFRKWHQKTKHSLLEKTFQSLPMIVGSKVKYTNISRDARAADVAAALKLLTQARVCALVTHTSANGIPLRASEDQRVFKPLFLDVGLMCTASGIRSIDIEKSDEITLINAGSLCEQFIGQHLLYAAAPYIAPELHYWVREKQTSCAEIDFVLSRGQAIVPVEVKAGTTGTLKSLHLFCLEKNSPLALRFNLGAPSIVESQGRIPTGDAYRYPLMSLPCYMVGETGRLLDAQLNR